MKFLKNVYFCRHAGSFVKLNMYKFSRGSFTNYVYSNGGGGINEMSILLNKFGKFYKVKLSTMGEGVKNSKNL